MKQEAVEYMQRVDIIEDNSASEQLLLRKSNYLIEQMKERNKISRNNKKMMGLIMHGKRCRVLLSGITTFGRCH